MIRRIFIGFVSLFLITACNPQGTPLATLRPGPTSTPRPPLTPTRVVTATTPASPTPPPRLLTICYGQEPVSLFPYDASASSARGILEAIYDGPFDIRGYDYRPVILTKEPSLADGDVAIEPVKVSNGDVMADPNGNLAYLGEGVSYRPSGCENLACALTYTGTQTVTVTMDQMVVRFKLLPGIRWSDGASLTADDSVYSFEVAKSLFSSALPDRIARTRSYRVLDQYTLEWRGVPGYRDPLYSANFFSPLPRHAWGNTPPQDLLREELSTKKPLGWGPYAIDQWATGDHISLHKNPYYFRAQSGLPRFDNLVYRFVSNSSEALNALLAGECDLADPTALAEIDLPQLLELQKSGRLGVIFQTGTAWELVDFGIASLDAKRPHLLAQKEVRQAIALCIDRQALVAGLFYGKSLVPDSYVPPDHPLYNSEVRHYAFDPQAAQALLQSAGWLDQDNDPATPRTAQNVAGVPDGTPLELTYLVSGDAERRPAAQMLQESLAKCGVRVELAYEDFQKYLAPGPEGPVFGRQFDMAQFAWPTTLEPPCYLYLSDEIPGPYPDYPRAWGGVNASGYTNPEFDKACKDAMSSLPGTPQHQEAHAKAQAVFAEDLPSIPLYLRLKVIASRPDFCGIDVDPSVTSPLWNLEGFDYGKGCGQ